MIDIVCYIPSVPSLISELKAEHPELISKEEETGKESFMVTKTPTFFNAQGEALTLIRGDDALVAIGEGLASLIMLGTYADVFATPALLDIYDSVYDRMPRVFLDEEGIEQTYQPSDKFGVFA